MEYTIIETLWEIAIAYNDLIFLQNTDNKSQGDAITPFSYKVSGQVERANYVNYSGYANTMSGRFMPEFLFRTSGY